MHEAIYMYTVLCLLLTFEISTLVQTASLELLFSKTKGKRKVKFREGKSCWPSSPFKLTNESLYVISLTILWRMN